MTAEEWSSGLRQRANGNTTIGTGVVGGMVIGTLALLFVLPALFMIFQWLQEKVKPIKFDKE